MADVGLRKQPNFSLDLGGGTANSTVLSRVLWRVQQGLDIPAASQIWPVEEDSYQRSTLGEVTVQW